MKKNIICLLISLTLAAFLLLLNSMPFYHIFELKLYDLRMNLRQAPTQDQRILFVEMDDEAVQNLGRWPWPRNIFSNIINTLDSLEAKQILFDVTFTQPTDLIVKKEAIKNILDKKNKEEFNLFIKNTLGAIKAEQSILQMDVTNTLLSIQSFFNGFMEIAKERLNYAIINNDEVLSKAFKDRNVFIGYSFEIGTEKQDIEKISLYPKIKKDILAWVKNQPDSVFNALPASIRSHSHFDEAELRGIFTRSKITLLLEKDMEISLSEVADKLKATAEELRSQYNSSREEFVYNKMLEFLNKNPEANYTQFNNNYMIFEPTNQSYFKKNIWPAVKNEFESIRQFTVSVPPTINFLQTKKMEPPFYKFTQSVKGGGFLNGIPNDDGVLRYAPLFVQYKDKIFPHISIASMLDFYNPEKIFFDSDKYLVFQQANVNGKLKNIRIPINNDGTIFINWTGKWQDTFRHISAAEIYRLYFTRDSLSGEEYDPNNPSAEVKKLLSKEKKLKKMVKGSICIIGLTAVGTHDYNPIPYDSSYPMVGTHGNIINSILTEQFIEKAPESYNILFMIALAIIIGISLSFLSAMSSLLMIVVLLIAISYLSLALFNNGIWINMLSPILLALFSYLGISSYKFASEEKDKRQIKKAFAKCVSPDVMEEILKDPSTLQLGGQKKIVTVLFSDIRSFTTYSEKRQPEEVVSILNEYLNAMTEVIMKNKGTLDKYVGDEIMALFGALTFESVETSAKRAVIASIQMLARLKELHKKWAEQGLEPLDIGIGLNTGEMVAGYMGSELRMDYTVIGDAVNLGARVEAETRNYNSYLIVTETVYEYIKDIAICRPLEKIKVKGKDIPVMIYDVTGLKTDKID